MKRYQYKGEKYRLEKFSPGQGKHLADQLIDKLPFQVKVSGNLTEQDVQKSAAIKDEMKTQTHRWTAYAKNMTEAIAEVPEVVEQQNRIRGEVLDAATKVVQSTAKLDEIGATHTTEVTKTYHQVTGNVQVILTKARLAVRFLKQLTSNSIKEGNTNFQLDSQLTNHRHQVKQSNARTNFRSRLAKVREVKTTYTLQQGDIEL
ncbi:hypothetical protein BV378_15295 [Nostoc sp. RF31YmG]|nr:hypothetical protein BV378_15295 [Nostoc sp. RF31YmG]